MNNLPDVIYLQIQTFLTHDDYHYFLAASKRNFAELRRKTIYFSLNEERSLEYVKNPHFTSFVLSRVENGWKQISLRLRDISYSFPQDLPVHRIRYYSILNDDLSAVGHIEHVTGERIKMREIPPIPKMKTLKLYQCGDLVDVKNLSHLERLDISIAPKLTDITPLQTIPKLHLSNCPSIESFDMLGQGKQVELSISSHALNDVSSFRKVRILSLCSPQITDVSPLHGIYDLALNGCGNVRDISGLGNHHRLYLNKCGEQLVGYDSLRGIPHIELYNIDISDLHVLSSVKTVRLSGCNCIEDVSPIKNARKVSIENCRKVRNLPQLADVPYLTLTGMTLRDEEGQGMVTLRNRKLHLCKHSGNYSLLSNVRELFITRRFIIASFLSSDSLVFKSLQSLWLSDCPNFFRVNGLGNIPTLHLLYCPDLRDISALGGNRCVELIYCPLIDDVSSLATVPIVRIRGCKGIKDYKCLEKVQRLKVWMK